MGIVGYAMILEGQLELPRGYTLEPQAVVEEESGQNQQVLLIRRADASVACAFAFDANSPMAEEVERRAWEDYYRATAEHGY